MNKDLLIKLIDQNLSSYEIARHFGVSPSTIWYWLKKYQLKTKYTKGGFFSTPRGRIINQGHHRGTKDMNTVDWKAVQEYAEQNHGWKEICQHFGLSHNMLGRARRKGLFIGRTKEQARSAAQANRKDFKHSPETRVKCSESRKKYLAENNLPAWKTHDKFKSIPCEQFKEQLTQLGIPFIAEHQPLRHIGRFFSIDVAFPDIKLGIEINGNQHYTPERTLKPYYQDRHDLIVVDGWELIEVPYIKVFDESYVNELVELIRLKIGGPVGV